jgi:glycine/D-amino acid oxidase-like deaminating enzyme
MRVAVIGGGIAGLATAYHLQEEARASGRTVAWSLN